MPNLVVKWSSPNLQIQLTSNQTRKACKKEIYLGRVAEGKIIVCSSVIKIECVLQVVDSFNSFGFFV